MYDQIHHGSLSYGRILKDLYPVGRGCPPAQCHHDPDLVAEARFGRRAGWRPAFGQIGAAQGHLKNQEIGLDDLFLFFGWFKHAECENGRYRFVHGAQDLHVIFGYLQVGEIIQPNGGDLIPDWLQDHPHANRQIHTAKNSCIYVARDRLSFDDERPGGGTLPFLPVRQLTKPGRSRSKWALPDCLRQCAITYHSCDSWRNGYFQSAAKGQEFVISVNQAALSWVQGVLSRS